MRQACCPVEHARMQVGNAVGSQTPVNKHQSTTVNQPSHSPHLFPVCSDEERTLEDSAVISLTAHRLECPRSNYVR